MAFASASKTVMGKWFSTDSPVASHGTTVTPEAVALERKAIESSTVTRSASKTLRLG